MEASLAGSVEKANGKWLWGVLVEGMRPREMGQEG